MPVPKWVVRKATPREDRVEKVGVSDKTESV